MNQKIQKSSLAAAVIFATTLAVTVPAKADWGLTAGAGNFVMTPIATEEVSVIETDVTTENTVKDATPAETAAVSEDTTDVQDLSAEESADPLNAENVISVSGDTTVIDASAAEGVKEDPVVLTVGAANALDDSLTLSDEEIQDEFEEEEASGKNFGYTHLGIVQVDDHLNVRASAEEDSKLVGKMENEAGCEILDVVGNMAHITSGSVEGYVNVEYLITGPEAVEYASTVVQEQATVKADGLKLREDKGTDAPVYCMVPYGEQMTVFEKDDNWVGVKYDGHKLYCAAEYVSVGVQLKTAQNMTEFLYGNGVSNVRMELCEYAKQFVGNPYVWGGVSLTKGCDCSGFVLSVYKKYGVSLPHSSRAQVNCGKRVKLSEAKPGDLVFYAKGKRINHVGIYIGGGQIVNASSPKTGIRIANVYYRTPVAVTRILQD